MPAIVASTAQTAQTHAGFANSMKRGTKLYVCVCCVVAGGAVGLSAEHLVVTNLARASSDRSTVGVWTNGAFITVEHAQSKAPLLHAYSQTGDPLQDVELTIPDAELINIYSGRFSRWRDGSWAVAGSAYSGDSRVTSFLALLSPDGRQRTIVRTAPYMPTAVTFASDGNIWTAGYEAVAGHEINPSRLIVRRFGRDGRLLSGAVARDSIVQKREPSVDCRLVASANKVVWYSVGAKLLVELSLDGTELKRYPLDTPKGMSIASCGGDNVWVSYKVGDKEKHWVVAQVIGSRQSQRTLPDSVGHLYGCDDTLGLGFGAGNNAIRWINQDTFAEGVTR